ncbi:MBL fold metallo-hydrolase [Candidatus Gottesmanbacteria bacterium]|nr:MBL fold metallo-hydrolase [Candidatus Gottesmanbacteria bacterium]
MEFKLRYGYVVSGAVIGLVLLVSAVLTLPDGKLHLVFCNVGQGDGAYVRFPDGHDMVVDGGPDASILTCLGRHMPFWDKTIDIVVSTHPQADHMNGLLPIFDRYTVGKVMRSDVDVPTQGYKGLLERIKKKSVPVEYVTTGDQVSVGSTTLSVVWPSEQQMAKAKNSSFVTSLVRNEMSDKNVLGIEAPPGDVNDYAVVFRLSYGEFDALFTGDADARVEADYDERVLAERHIEVLKVPHHGSRTGMTDEFLDLVRPDVAIISVGKNNYGHPTAEILSRLAIVKSKVLRTDKDGDIEIVSDGRSFTVSSKRNN